MKPFPELHPVTTPIRQFHPDFLREMELVRKRDASTKGGPAWTYDDARELIHWQKVNAAREKLNEEKQT